MQGRNQRWRINHNIASGDGKGSGVYGIDDTAMSDSDIALAIASGMERGGMLNFER